MKRVILFLLLIVPSAVAFAQSELPADTLHHTPSSNLKEYGDFLLDMSLMNVKPVEIPRLNLELPKSTEDYSRMFRFNNDAVYTQMVTNFFSPFGRDWGFFSSPQYLQMGSFKLGNGWRLNTYGEYTKEGWRVPNHNALPWERNTFHGAFELKSSNGNFGFRIEVQR
ncbi:MAG: occludin [Mediterranea sp.]|jgi:glycogen debranching enzyme|nr:occludin [Mediterranea sp.]